MEEKVTSVFLTSNVENTLAGYQGWYADLNKKKQQKMLNLIIEEIVEPPVGSGGLGRGWSLLCTILRFPFVADGQ